MLKLKISRSLVIAALASLAGFTGAVHAGTIGGTTAGGMASGDVGDDTITASTIDMAFFTSCSFITKGVNAQGFGGYNFVFAGQNTTVTGQALPNGASAPAAIDPSDFTISGYKPWIGNNNRTTNFITGPDGSKYSRGVTNDEDGGCNIAISYTPKAGSDPTKINFLQAYTDTISGKSITDGTIDNGGKGGPFYNQNGVAGTGTKASNAVPLMTSAAVAGPPAVAAVPGWLVDIPYTPEWGYDRKNLKDDTISQETVTFQTFISSQQTIGGKVFNVLYGGVQWGYSFSETDLPKGVAGGPGPIAPGLNNQDPLPVPLPSSVGSGLVLMAGCFGFMLVRSRYGLRTLPAPAHS